MLCLGCADMIGPYAVERIQPLETWRAEYDWVWRECASALRETPTWEYKQLTFYQVNAVTTFNGRTGLWDRDRIYLIREAVYQPEPVILRHEFLHAQLGRKDHPAIFAYCERRALVPPEGGAYAF